MTPQEQQMIQGLIDRIRQTPPTDKDPEAERLLQQGLGQSPDALYVLAQTVLVQNYALEQAQRQMKDLRAQMEQARQQAVAPAPEKHTSFLGSIFGKSDGPAPQTSVVRQSQPIQGQTYAPPPPPMPQYAPVPGYAGPGQGYAPQPASSPMGGFGQAMGGGGGFLRGAAQTAAGVAAGALAFEGVESLMHGFGGGGGMGSGLGGFGGGGLGGGAPREEVINNYYGDSGGEGGREGRGDDSGFYNPSDDASRQGLGSDVEDRRGFDDASGGGDDASMSGGDDFTGGDTGTDDSSAFDSGDSFGGGDDSSFS